MGEDEDLFVRLAAKARLENLSDFVLQRRIHSGSVCSQYAHLIVGRRKDLLRPASDFPPAAAVSPSMAERTSSRRLGAAAWRGKKRSLAFRYYLRSLWGGR